MASKKISPVVEPLPEGLQAKITAAVAEGEALKRALAQDDQYVAGDPEKTEEREAEFEKREARAKDRQSSATDRKVLLLEEQLAETRALVERLAKDKGGYNAVGKEAMLMVREDERRAVYERIRANGGMCTIVIHTHEDPAQNFDVFLGVNGRGITVRRGEQTVIPVEYLQVLDHAIIDTYTKRVNEVTGDPYLVHDVRLSYPYSLIDYSGQRLESLHSSRKAA